MCKSTKVASIASQKSSDFSHPTLFNLSAFGKKPVELRFDLEETSSDGGLLLLKEVENQVGIIMSFKSKMFNFLIRNGHVFQGKLKKEVFDFNTSIPEFRDRCEKGAKRFGRLPKKITIKKQIIHGINSEWLIPQGTTSDKIILYFHGGGYVSGSCNDRCSNITLD